MKLLLSLLSIAVIAVLLKFNYNTDITMTAISIGSGWFAFAKISMCYSFFSGHGVGIVKGTKKTGLPIVFIVVYSIIAMLVIGLLILGYMMSGDFESAGNNSKHMSWSLMAGLIISLLYWFFYMKEVTHRGSEYDARCEFEHSGNSDEEIKQKITALKNFEVIQ